MRVACIVEGESEYDCVPAIVCRFGHIIIGVLHMGGGNNEKRAWEDLFQKRVIPRALAMARKHPERLLIVVDREGRPECCGNLAQAGKQLVCTALEHANLNCDVSVVVANRKFENLLFADFDLVDRLPILDRPLAPELSCPIDGVGVLSKVHKCSKKGQHYDKRIHGHAIAKKMDVMSEVVRGRSRCLSKLLRELERPLPAVEPADELLW